MMACEIALFAFIPLADKYLNVGKKCLTKSLHRIFILVTILTQQHTKLHHSTFFLKTAP